MYRDTLSLKFTEIKRGINKTINETQMEKKMAEEILLIVFLWENT